MTEKKGGITLNLGGGAARGFAHIGVLRAVEELRIPYDLIIGVSMGAFVGAVYSIVPDYRFVRERLEHWLNSDLVQDSVVMSYNRSLTESTRSVMKKVNSIYTKTGALGRILLSPGMLPAEDVIEAFSPYLAPIDIRHTRIPFACVAVGLESGLARIFSEGSLRYAVLASSAMPMVFPPVKIGEEEYCDGGVLDKIGLDSARQLGYRRILAIDVSNEGLPESEMRSGLDVLFRTEEISSLYRRNQQLTSASIVIKPIKGNIHWADYSALDELVDMGYESIREHEEEIRYRLGLVNPFRKIFHFFRYRR